MLVNALASTLDTPRVSIITLPMLTFISTVGGGRLLLNIRALAASKRNPSSTAVARPGDPNFFDTEGTLGRFWPVDGGRRKNDDDCAASISMGIWSNEDVQQNRPPSPTPVIMLKAVPPGRRRLPRLPSPTLVSTSGEEGLASSSRLSSSGPKSEQEALQLEQRNEHTTSESPKPRASSFTTTGSVGRTQDPDVELGGSKAVT
ncbi:hypothetical protein FS837_001716 [Tulasnella sp. UAMH 9824]|nr:hypothetical protein FS837_001716 [Tulasnella sp. UAMH 9824]